MRFFIAVSFLAPYFIVLSALALVGCSKGIGKCTEITTKELSKIVTVDPLDHCIYLGSDKEYHYIKHSRSFGSHKYRISRTLLKFDRIFEVGKEDAYIIDRTMLNCPAPTTPPQHKRSSTPKGTSDKTRTKERPKRVTHGNNLDHK